MSGNAGLQWPFCVLWRRMARQCARKACLQRRGRQGDGAVWERLVSTLVCLIYFTTGQQRPAAGLSWNYKVENPGIRKLLNLPNSKLIPLIPESVFTHLWIAAKSTVAFSHLASVYKIIMWPSSPSLLEFLSILSCLACFAASLDVKEAKPTHGCCVQPLMRSPSFPMARSECN